MTAIKSLCVKCHRGNSGKKVCGKTAEELKQESHIFTPDQVCRRWKTLIRAYKKVKAYNAKSGHSLKVFQFEQELDEIFSKNPIMERVKRCPHQVQKVFEEVTQLTQNS